MRNEEVAAALEELAELLSLQAENPFRIRAYQRAAQVIRGHPHALAAYESAAELDALPAIGSDLAGKIWELLRTGRMRALEQLRKRVPAGLRELLKLPGLGPVRVRALYSALGIKSRAELQRALAAGKVAGLPRFGKALEAKLKSALAEQQGRPLRWARHIAAAEAGELSAYLSAQPLITRVEVAGSFRRGRDTVGDLDLIVCARPGFHLAETLRAYQAMRALSAAGPTRCSGVLRNGMAVDVRLMPEASLGAALHYFTGSRAHNLQLRRRAQERGLKLNEYGLFRGEGQIAGASELEVYQALDLPWIAPELREDRGEFAAAATGTLPQLITRADLQGDLHAHTEASDGREALPRMAAAARAAGLRYLAITDHSRYLGIYRGLDAGRLAAQIDAIDELNAKLRGLTLLKGVEVDILEDGALALPDEILGRLDLVVAAIHGHFELSIARQTARVLRALDRPFLSILAHPTARLIGERDGIRLDMDRVLEAAARRPCYLELNAQPLRLDCDDLLAKAAREHGVLVSIASDAHSGADFGYLEDGVRQGRRGWLTPRDVLNARPLAEAMRLLQRTRRA
jgi:DNA polymerase (family X)